MISNTEELLPNVKEHPYLKAAFLAAISAAPAVGGSVSVLADAGFSSHLRKKQELLVSMILQGKPGDLTLQQVTAPFIVNFARTLDAVNRLATNEKIKYFANLLSNGYLGDEPIDENDFDETFYNLVALSHREIQILLILYRIECAYEKDTHAERSEMSLPWKTEVYWGKFESELIDNLKIPKEDITSHMKAIERSGYFAFPMGMRFGVSHMGRLTCRFYKIVQLIGDGL